MWSGAIGGTFRQHDVWTRTKEINERYVDMALEDRSRIDSHLLNVPQPR